MHSTIIIRSPDFKTLLEIARAVSYKDIPHDMHISLGVCHDVENMLNTMVIDAGYDISELTDMAMYIEDIALRDAYTVFFKELSDYGIDIGDIMVLDNTGSIAFKIFN